MAYVMRNNYRNNQFNNGRCMQGPSQTSSCPCDAPSVCPPEPEPEKMTENCCNMALAMAYVPWQHFKDIYDPCIALDQATVFPELFKPFHITGGGCR